MKLSDLITEPYDLSSSGLLDYLMTTNRSNVVAESLSPRLLPYVSNSTLRTEMLRFHGVDACFDSLNAVLLDTWREYKLYSFALTSTDLRFVLLMTCPSTNERHVIPVDPSISSCEEAVVWINHGIHPDQFVVQT